MDIFYDKYSKFLLEFGKSKNMVLSVCENNRVSSRMMSIVQSNGIFYFQTDITLNKYHQLINNPNIALCIDNIQIEGVCKELGHPLEFTEFCNLFQVCFKGSYDAYTSLKNERLFAINPILIERWIYKNGNPYIETYDITAKKYNLCQYHGT